MLPVIGMIHLAGDKPVKKALDEILIFEEERVDGAIIENYHGSAEEVIETLKETSKLKTKVLIGVNILPNEFSVSFPLAGKYNSKFIQLDHVAGSYMEGALNLAAYASFKGKYPDIIVLGGVWPKYYHPEKGSDLEKDLREGMKRAEAIVVTGEGTGKETPLDKIKRFRKVLGNHPLIIGAGLTLKNAYEQLCIADGAIVGTSFKFSNNTCNPVERGRVKDFMSIVKEARKYKENSILG